MLLPYYLPNKDTHGCGLRSHLLGFVILPTNALEGFVLFPRVSDVRPRRAIAAGEPAWLATLTERRRLGPCNFLLSYLQSVRFKVQKLHVQAKKVELVQGVARLLICPNIQPGWWSLVFRVQSSEGEQLCSRTIVSSMIEGKRSKVHHIHAK